MVPAWNLYMLARRALVMSGFMMPKPEEVSLGLTTLGTTGGFNIGSALDDPFGVGAGAFAVDEPSGRLTATSAHGLDPAYPRNVVRDRPADVSDWDLVSALGLTGNMRYAGDGSSEFKPSEWVAPWRYPLRNQAGTGRPMEGEATHAGPYVVGDRSTVLLSGPRRRDGAPRSWRRAATPADTFARLTALLAQDRHLGTPDRLRDVPGRRACCATTAKHESGCRTSTWTPTAATPGSAGTGTATTSAGTRVTRRPGATGSACPDFTATQQSDFSYRAAVHAAAAVPRRQRQPAPARRRGQPAGQPVVRAAPRPQAALPRPGAADQPPEPFGDDPCKQGPGPAARQLDRARTGSGTARTERTG